MIARIDAVITQPTLFERNIIGRRSVNENYCIIYAITLRYINILY